MSQLNKKSVEQNVRDNLIDIQNILGEVLWHALTVDPTIEEVSRQHFKDIEAQVAEYASADGKTDRFGKGCKFLEVAAYAHVTGYLFAVEKDWQVTLSDVSVDTLALGESHASQMGLDTSLVRRSAVDFHDLPFETGEFDVVYISAALHHTKRWETVLRELMRVVAPGGLLILQCEPLNREFCLYNFESNRPEEFRKIEAELDRLEIFRTIAQPYPGSRPEALFGMIENQNMAIDVMLSIVEEKGKISCLDIDTNICLSAFENSILSAGKDEAEVERYIIKELSERASIAEVSLTDLDRLLGINMPTLSDIESLAKRVAPMVTALPDPEAANYKTVLATIFGGSVKITAQISGNTPSAANSRYPVYCKDKRKQVDIAYPTRLSDILEITEDLLPDIQDASVSELDKYFMSPEWNTGFIEGSDAKFFSLMERSGKIGLMTDVVDAALIVLLRVWANPSPVPFRVSLCLDEEEVAGFDVYQAESFLLNAFVTELEAKPAFSLRVLPIGPSDLPAESVMPVTVGAVRIIAINNVS